MGHARGQGPPRRCRPRDAGGGVRAGEGESEHEGSRSEDSLARCAVLCTYVAGVRQGRWAAEQVRRRDRPRRPPGMCGAPSV